MVDASDILYIYTALLQIQFFIHVKLVHTKDNSTYLNRSLVLGQDSTVQLVEGSRLRSQVFVQIVREKCREKTAQMILFHRKYGKNQQCFGH